VAVLSALLICLVVTTLAALGVMSPWSPVMDAGTALATPVAYVQGRSPLELQGRARGPEQAVPELSQPRR
jgi:hypothetical protein